MILFMQMSLLPRFATYLVTSLVLCAAYLVIAQPAFAKDFQADYAVDYTVDTQQKTTKVKQSITLTNNQPNLRASSYSLTLEKGSYSNLNAYDSRGKMAFTETESDGSQLISFTFNDRVVGQGAKLRWTIEYNSTSIAKLNGQMWDVTIPRIREHPSYDIASYSVNLITPSTLGEAHYITPQPASYRLATPNNTYTFNKNHMMAAGIVASYGQAQIFEFELTYHLANPNIGQASTEIALPPDIEGYQQIIHGKLTPEPASLRTDQDGNALATYYLGPRADLDVVFSGWARIDQKKAKLDSKQLASDLPKELVKNYTVSQKYWETNNPKLQEIAKQITDPQKPVVENARAIYNYVTDTLSYNTGRINADLARLGAAEAIEQPENAVCMEFTDLFITLARLAGIPAREIDGYAYTTGNDAQPIYYPELGSDILHAWAQIYLPEQGWVMVDPTWGSTTEGIDFFGQIDLNRIAFVVKGLSSQYPYAAGAYKTNAEQDGDVQVAFSQQHVDAESNLAVELTTDTSPLGSFTQQPQITLTNTGSSTLYQLNVTVNKDDPNGYLQDINQQVPRLLPGESYAIDLKSGKTNWWSEHVIPANVSVTATNFGQEALTYNNQIELTIPSLATALLLPILIIIALIAAITALIWYTLHWLHSRQAGVGDSPLPPTTPDPAAPPTR